MSTAKTFSADGGGSQVYHSDAITPGHVKQIDLLFKTHLDLGFTDFSAEIEKKYYKIYIPNAMRLAKAMRESGDRRFVWTIGSYLVYGFLQQANTEETACMEEAIRCGDISWHALPLTTHTELMDECLLEYGISLSRELDERYGKKTIAAKMTDVPGHTAAMIPVLCRMGIEFLHIGVNPASGVPDVPDIFRWRAPDGSEIVVMYAKDDYGSTTAIPGCDTAISFAHTGDNRGPQSMDDVRRVYDTLETSYPGIPVHACGLNEFAGAVLRVKDQLPLVEGEIGDTWIYGAGTDPAKVAAYRTLLRLRTKWLQNGSLRTDTEEYRTFSRHLLCVPEHTWGMARFILNDYEHYSKEQLRELRKTDICQRVEESWKEQRDYTVHAFEALTTPSLREEARRELEELRPLPFDPAGYTRLPDGETIRAGAFVLGFNRCTGALEHLHMEGRSEPLATPEHPCGEFMYEIFSNEDFRQFTSAYLKNIEKTKDWSIPTFTKPGVPDSIRHTETTASHAAVFYRHIPGGTDIRIRLTMPATSTETFGCPRDIVAAYFVPDTGTSIHIRLTLRQKDACRYTEALWFRFNPPVRDPMRWKMDKIGMELSPFDVIAGGNRHLHAVQNGVSWQDGTTSLRIRTLDAPLIGMGCPAVVYFNNTQPDLERGFFINLFNNQWNTNFRYWYEDDAVFRFELSF